MFAACGELQSRSRKKCCGSAESLVLPRGGSGVGVVLKCHREKYCMWSSFPWPSLVVYRVISSHVVGVTLCRFLLCVCMSHDGVVERTNCCILFVFVVTFICRRMSIMYTGRNKYADSHGGRI